MRGKVAPLGQGVLHFRITPAYAGKRHLHHRHLGDLQDHPRLCGEKLVDGETYEDHKGSPPPMRGKESANLPIFVEFRITPAYAGKRRIFRQ